ncbi:MAG: hypothetical protein M0D57_08405 [Sphingobacteriales bacterium JAD_PAG50586_3]|nr:MAG: hypothetical protein M0D57_08405 [Sphingobacteriales bacterium JAD_PAG50586_3]
MRRLAYLLVCIMGLLSCKKDGNDCTPLDTSQNLNYSFDKDFVYKICLNPSNDNELFLVMQKNAEGPHQLYKLDLTNSAYTLIYQDNIWNGFDVSPDGEWILLTLGDAKIWKIKTNGDSLQKIVDMELSVYPTFNTNHTFSFLNNNVNKHFLADLDGNILDTLDNHPAMSNFVDYINDSIAVAKNYTADKCFLSTYNVKSHVINNIKEVDPGSVVSPIFIGQNTMLWANKEGVYTTSILSGNTTKIRSSCSSIRYLTPTVNSSKSQVIWVKYIYNQDKDNLSQVYLDTKLILSDSGFGFEQTLTKPSL